MRTPAPRLGQHNAELLDEKKSARVSPSQSSRAAPSVARRELPLAGIRVLDFTWAWAGPFCTLQLAHLGAEVIRIETEKRICVTRGLPPFADDVPGPNRAGYYNQYNQGKRSITMDLSRPEAIQIALEMARHCDVVTDNFAAGVMERLGLGYEKFRAQRPDIVMLSMSGYGQTGPLKNYVSYGPPAAATAGFFSLSGYEGHGPSEIGISYADPNAGIFGAVAVMVALLHRKLTGTRPVHRSIATRDRARAASRGPARIRIERHAARSAPAIAIAGWRRTIATRRRATTTNGSASRSAPRTNGAHCARQSVNRRWPAIRAFKTRRLANKMKTRSTSIITRWTRTRDRWEVTRELQQAGVAAFPAMSNKDLATDEHLRERGYLVQMEHPLVGRRIHAGIPWTMSGTPCRIRHAAPLRGADTDSVLKELLGYSADEIGKLRAAGVLS